MIWRDDVVTVPIGSLFRRGDGWAVFVVENGHARLRTVELGQRNDDAGQILNGLQAGQTVVLHPPDTLADGTRVIGIFPGSYIHRRYLYIMGIWPSV